MCSTPKRAGTMFRAARVEESRTDSPDYVNMLRRASSRMDSIERERDDVHGASRQPLRDDPGYRRKPPQTPPESTLLSRVWHYLNTPHYLFR